MDEVPSETDGLHEFVDLDLSVTGLNTPADEKTLQSALQELSGIRSLSILAGKVEIDYEPVSLTKAQVVDAIKRAGFGVAEGDTALASPVADAFREEDVAHPS